MSLPQKILVGAAHQIHALYASAVAGVKVSQQSRLPASLEVKPDSEYFKLSCEGPYWQQVLETSELAILYIGTDPIGQIALVPIRIESNSHVKHGDVKDFKVRVYQLSLELVQH